MTTALVVALNLMVFTLIGFLRTALIVQLVSSLLRVKDLHRNSDMQHQRNMVKSFTQEAHIMSQGQRGSSDCCVSPREQRLLCPS